MTRLNLGYGLGGIYANRMATMKAAADRNAAKPQWQGPPPPQGRLTHDFSPELDAQENAAMAAFKVANPGYQKFLDQTNPPKRQVSTPATGTPGFTTPLNLGALPTRPMTIGGATAGTPSPSRRARPEGPTPMITSQIAGNPANIDPGIADRFYGNGPRPGQLGFGMTNEQMVRAAQGGFGGAAQPNPNGAAANGGAARQRNDGPGGLVGLIGGLPPFPTMPQQPGAPRKPTNGTFGGIGMNIPNPAITASQMIGAQNNAMNSAVAALNNPAMRVSGPLSSVTGPSGALQNPGLYTAQYNNSPKAQQTIGAMGDVGDARWRANMGPGDTYTDQGQIIRSGAGGSGGAGGSTGTGASGSSGAGAAGGTSPSAPNGAQQILDPLVAQFQQAMDAANASNQQRYDQGLGMLQANQASGQADLARMGQSRAQEIRDDARRASAQGMQNLTARGLANTTNLPTMQRGVARDANRAQTALGDAMAQNRFNQNRATTNDITNWIYQRDDQAPNYDTLANLALGLAQSQVQPPAFDINDVMSRLGRTPSIQDLLSMLPQLQGGNLQQPYMQYPNLPNINFPQQGQQQGGGGHQFFVNGPGFVGGGAGGGLGGVVNRPQPPQQQQLQPPPGGFGGSAPPAYGSGGNNYTGANSAYWNGTVDPNNSFVGALDAAENTGYGSGIPGIGYFDNNGRWIPYQG